MVSVEPLPPGQQLLLQHLLASHVMTDEQAKALFRQIGSAEMQCESLEQCFGQINTELTKGFGLEVVTVSMQVGSNNKKKKKYHAIINQHADEVAKKSFTQHYNAKERSLVRLVFRHLVENGPSPRSTLINLRNDLSDALKLSLAESEHCIETLLEEFWLVLIDASAGGNRRESMSTKIDIAPRSYLELSHLLQGYGLPEDDLPQFIFHRA